MPVNCSETRFQSSWMAVELPMKMEAILRPLGGIHSTKYEEFLFCTFSICSSTSLVDMRPRKRPHAVRYRPWRGSAAHIMFFASNICCVSSGTVSARYCCEARERNHVDGEFAQVRIELAREPEAARDAGEPGT